MAVSADLQIGQRVRINYPPLANKSAFALHTAVVVRRKDGGDYGLVLDEPVDLSGDQAHSYIYEQAEFLEPIKEST